MKYIITAKNVDVNPSLTVPELKTEICTELVMTRLKTIELLNTGIISKQDTIVTRIDRKCFYENLFENIIDWSEFEKIETKNDEVIDLASKIDILCGATRDEYTIKYFPFYNRFETDKNEIFNIKISSNIRLSEKYVCLLVRKKENINFINLDDNFYLEIIEKLKEKNINVFVFGEKISEIILQKSNVFFLKDLNEWCCALNNPNCISVISTISGGVTPIFFVGHEKSKLILIDHHQYVNRFRNKQTYQDPSFYGDCINFKKVEIKVIEKIPTINEIYEILF